MELASFLAGERWSDHPRCTHPLLAALARLVNDYTFDANRSKLAVLVPSVIGVTSDDPRLDARIALRCATTALPIASFERQRVMAVSVITAERVLAELDGDASRPMTEQSHQVLMRVPHAKEWAERYTRRTHTSLRHFQRYAAPSTVRYAVDGIARACVADPDGILRNLLASVIEDARRFVSLPPRATAAPEDWEALGRLTGVLTAQR